MKCTQEYETVLANVLLMLKRRGCTDVITYRKEQKDLGELVIVRNPTTKEMVYVHFIIRGEKVSVGKMRFMIGDGGNTTTSEQDVVKKRIVIIHDFPLTPDANTAVAANTVFVFEMHNYDDMMYDPLEYIDNPYELYTGPPIKEINKLPKISDVITRYMAFPVGSVVAIKDFRTHIPALYVVMKSLGDDIRKK